MMKNIVTLLVVAGILVTGCGNEKKNEETTQHKNIQTSEKSTPVSGEETKLSANDPILKKTDEMMEESEKQATAIQEKADPVIEESKEAATDIVETIHEKTESAVQETKETSMPLEETVKEKSIPVVIPATETAAEVTQKETETFQDNGAQETVMESPEVVVLENNKGKVTLPHKQHSDSFDCETCHGENEPGPLSLGKDAAHKLCKECHKEIEAGPTKCSGCHKKTE